MKPSPALLVLLAMSACASEERAPFDERASPSPSNSAPPAPPAPGLGGSTNTSNGPSCVSTNVPPAAKQITIDSAYAAHYRAYDLGQVPGMPAYKYGGIVVSKDDPDVLLIGGNANYPEGSIHAVRVIRNACHHII